MSSSIKSIKRKENGKVQYFFFNTEQEIEEAKIVDKPMIQALL